MAMSTTWTSAPNCAKVERGQLDARAVRRAEAANTDDLEVPSVANRVCRWPAPTCHAPGEYGRDGRGKDIEQYACLKQQRSRKPPRRTAWVTVVQSDQAPFASVTGHLVSRRPQPKTDMVRWSRCIRPFFFQLPIDTWAVHISQP
jgi:hypothetical protein